MTTLTPARPPRRAGRDQRSFLLQRAQPAMNGLIDGSLSTLAPIFAVAFATHQPHYAFFAGLSNWALISSIPQIHTVHPLAKN